MVRRSHEGFGGVLEEEFLYFDPGHLLGGEHAYARDFVLTDVEVVDDHAHEQIEQEHVPDDDPGHELQSHLDVLVEDGDPPLFSDVLAHVHEHAPPLGGRYFLQFAQGLLDVVEMAAVGVVVVLPLTSPQHTLPFGLDFLVNRSTGNKVVGTVNFR